MSSIKNITRERLARGETALGIGIRLARTVDIGKAMKTAGYDWLFIDLEHGPLSLDTAAQMSVAGFDAGIAPIVRVPHGEYTMATRALDSGALGIVMPHVDTADEARTVVEKLRYPPQGHRSVAGSMAVTDFKPMKIGEQAALINATNLIVVMLETPRAIENADAIAAVPGIDILLIGTNDLCAEMGIPGDFSNPKVEAAYAKTIAACKAHGKWPGMGGVYTEPLLQKYVAMGMRFVLCGSDFSFMQAAATQRAEFVRKLG
jgi:4-hydroxy-2-oxoheptanedioate aldolase